MGTGIDHSPGLTSSTGGMTFLSHADFCAVPVTTTTTGTVHGKGVRVVHRQARSEGVVGVGGSRPPGRPRGCGHGKSLKCAGPVPTMRASTRPWSSAMGHRYRVGRGVMADHRETSAGGPSGGTDDRPTGPDRWTARGAFRPVAIGGAP